VFLGLLLRTKYIENTFTFNNILVIFYGIFLIITKFNILIFPKANINLILIVGFSAIKVLKEILIIRLKYILSNN
jgi:hypothetical protein